MYLCVYIEWRQEMKLDLLDIIAAILGPVLAIFLVVGVVKVNFIY